MKLIPFVMYFFSTLLLSGCVSNMNNGYNEPAMAIQQGIIVEHPLVEQVRQLSGQLLQQPYFYQGCFRYGLPLQILFPRTSIDVPVAYEALQQASLEIISQPNWFDIQILTQQQSHDLDMSKQSGYLLMIKIMPNEIEKDNDELTLELINNRFNTVEAQVNSSLF